MIVGLGNPGETYRDTRHNLGHFVVDDLAARLQVKLSASSHGICATAVVADRHIVLAKPNSFVNTSGPAIKGLLKEAHGLPADLIIVHDDLDLDFGILRIKSGGGSGGHRGLNSIIAAMETAEFTRIRVGIGRPPGRMEPADFVLAPFTPKEWPEMQVVIGMAGEAALAIVSEGLSAAMNTYNKK